MVNNKTDIKPENEIFAQRLRELRDSVGMNQKSFASQFDVKETAYSAYETARVTPPTSFLIKVAEKYALSLDWLCGISNKKSQTTHIRTCADAINCLLPFDENNIFMSIFLTDREEAGLLFSDEKMYEFFTEWGNIRELKHKALIKPRLYDLWVDDVREKYQTPLQVIEPEDAWEFSHPMRKVYLKDTNDF